MRLVEAMAEFLDDYALGQQLSRLALRSVTEPLHEAMLLNNLRNFDFHQRSWQSAESNDEKSFRIVSQLEDSVRAAQTLVNLGIVAIQQEQLTAAICHWKTAIAQLPSDLPELRAIQE